MKLPTFAFIAATLACGFASATTTAYTTPVGYETQTLQPGTFNLAGVRLFNSPVAAGTFQSNTSTTLVDTNATFSLDAATNYIVEFPNGATITALGSNFSGTTLSGLTGINGTYVGAYLVRKALTISSVFGANDESGLGSSPNAAVSEADVIYLPDGAGGFIRVFYSTYTDDMAYNGWLNADTYEKAAGQVINPTEALFVQTTKSVAPISLVTTGEIKKTSTAFVANDSFSLVGAVYPAGSTLASSGLKNYLTASPNAAASEADVIFMPDGAGNFVRAFYTTYTDDMAYNGWLNADTYAQIPDQALTPGFFINKIGSNISGLMTAPASYSGL